MTSTTAARVSIPSGWLWLFRLGGAALGFGLAFAVRPVTDWLTDTLSIAPGPLRLAVQIPIPWLVAVLSVVGLGVGIWVAAEAQRDSLTLTVEGEGITVEHRDIERYLQRSRIGSMFTDPKELVVLDTDGLEIFRGPASDLPTSRLVATLRRYDYPWVGTTDPHEADYRRWVDGHPDLDETTNALLRARHQAVRSDDRTEAERLHDRIQANGIAVRDRDKKQEYRRLPRETTTK